MNRICIFLSIFMLSAVFSSLSAGIGFFNRDNNFNKIADDVFRKGPKTPEIVFQQPIPPGKALIAKSDCMTCHKENKKLIGPSFLEIARKYKADKKSSSYLSSKIIDGGKGVWGNIPMNAHPSISKKDANEMVKYILSVQP